MSARTHDGAGLEILDSAECRRLLGSVPVGRIVYTDQAMPAIQPVNFVVHEGAVVIRVRDGSTLAAATRNAVVAFEADDFDREYHRGWSVVVVGHAQEVIDLGTYQRLAELPLRPWAPGSRDHIVRIPLDVVHGRRIPPPAQRQDPSTVLTG
jgi:nitroimidazol reductase NimA-like FMN-containing flavoprotein (pyridoxamine 5'-phosphate oxidase superfamily)